MSAALAEAGLDGDPVVDLAQLATSELASNAVVHARTPFEVTLVVDSSIRVAVRDGSTAAPELRAAGDHDESGRGILLIDALADRWGYEREPDGKWVWCDLAPQREAR